MPRSSGPRKTLVTCAGNVTGISINADNHVLPMPKTFRPVMVFILAFALLSAAEAAAEAEKKVRLLTLGNSFAGNALQFLEPMAKATGHNLEVRRCNPGGCSLAQHWERIQLGDADPANPNGQYDGKTLSAILADGPWDVITIQQYSLISHDLASYRPYAADLVTYLKQRVPQAEIVMHQTWAYRCDDARFVPTSDVKTQQDMYDGVTKSYDTMATDLGLRLMPSGDAFWAADHDPLWGYKPDTAFVIANAVEPALPNQTHSLHVGYRWNKHALAMDGHHAGQAGCYLAGLVWYESIFHQSCVDMPFTPSGMDPKYAAFLRQTAHAAVAARQVKSP